MTVTTATDKDDPAPVTGHAAPARRTSRHPGDLARVVVGAAVFAMSLLAVQRAHLSLFERDLFRLVNNLPSLLEPLLVAVMQAGNIVAAPVAAGLALFTRARRLALDVVVAGPTAWFVAKAVKGLVERPRPGGFLDDIARYDSGGLGFVSGHMAVAAALATAAGPYLPRRARRLVWAAAWSVGFARIYVGAHLPMDVLGGAALGWVVGASLHLVLGAPHRVPGLDEARRALERAGWKVTRVSRVGHETSRSFPFIATGPQGARFVKLLDPEPRDRDWIFRIARLLVFRDVRDEAVMVDTRLQGEHEAAMTLLAREAGCRVPAIVGIQHVGRQTWVMEQVAGASSLDRWPTVDDELLEAVWEQVARLHGTGIAHRDLVAANVVIDDKGRPSLVDFAHALAHAAGRERDNDVAELLTSTALLVGPGAAVRAAVTVLGPEAVSRAAPELQPFALTAATRGAARHVPGLLDDLRHLAAVAGSGGPAQPLPPPSRSAQLRMLGAGLVGITALLLVAGPGAVFDQLAAGAWRWYGVVLLAAVGVAVLAGALVVAAVGRRVALGRMVLAWAEAVVAGPTTGRTPAALLARRLRRSGLGGAEASVAALRTGSARSWTAAAGVVVASIWALTEGVRWSLPPRWWILVPLAVALGALVAPRSDALERHRAAAVAFPPRQRLTLALVAGSELAVGSLVLVAAEKACGGDATVATAVLAWAAASVAMHWLHGAPGVAEIVAVLVLAGGGLALPVAAATVLVARGFTYWLVALVATLVLTPLHRRSVGGGRRRRPRREPRSRPAPGPGADTGRPVGRHGSRDSGAGR